MDITFGMMFSQVAELFALLVIGYWMNRRRVLPAEAETVLSKISARLFLPALMIYTFMEECTAENLKTYSSCILYGSVFMLVSILLSCLIAKPMEKRDAYRAGVYRYAMSFPNTGGYGTPIVLALFGHTGLFQYQLYCLALQVLCYSWGTGNLMPPEHRGGWKKQLRNLVNPVLLSIAIGAVLGLTGVGKLLPEAVGETLSTLGGCYSTIGLLLTGFVLGNYSVREVIGDKLSYLLALLRLLVIPCAFMVVLRLMRAPELLFVMTCLAFGCPCGMNSVVFPAAYGQDTRPGTSLVLVTSTLAVFTIPFLFLLM